MEAKQKKRFFLSHKKSSALMVSILIHAVFAVVAVTFVAVNVITKPETVFEVKEVQRPKVPLRKLQVPVKDQKKTQAPKLRQNIVTKPRNKEITIQMPDIVGVRGGTGYGTGTGLGGLGFNFDGDLFGGSRGTGNEFVGTFFDLKQRQDGKITDIGEAAARDSFGRETQLMACKVIKGFIGSGWNDQRFDDYFKAPKLKYATTFMMPPMSANAAPKAFAVENQVKGSYWVCHYKGQIAAPETGRYRFCGIGDDVLVVRVGRQVVLDACWPEIIGEATSWNSRDDNNRRFGLNSYKYGRINVPNLNDYFDEIEKEGGMDGDAVFGNVLRSVQVDGRNLNTGGNAYMALASRMVIGDWVTLQKGQPVDVDILIGEIPGGDFICRLLIEQEGKKYKMVNSDAGPRPILPVFKTTAVDDQQLIRQMEVDPNEMTMDGPVFGVLINSTP